MSFREIDQKRRERNISISALCRAAGVARSTYQFARAGRHNPNKKTEARLRRALVEIKSESKISLPCSRTSLNGILRNLYRACVIILAKELGVDPEAVLSSNPQVRATASEGWRQAAYVRALAVYCVGIYHDVPAAQVGRAIGLTRAAVSQINRRAHDFRDDPKIDALVERIGVLVSG